ncbi:DUF72 domain-containing protein [Herbiconiux sp. L3-i23]|uniref:DUF72 domain-containing protein n=1 Tax=Herbiconiux sp. L3-i23 TaxID=2905871 RepID=UPI00205B4F3A|nr:DUF72 domain-containing protein [Herbiconiux sp. L3-i23]BDI22921.1 hypothetical protein L3i23_16970 [Herbiconiux sp. L3-i23]
MTGRAYIGISGWRYTSWRGRFYPKGLVQRRELEYSASRFDSVEINGSFYSLQRPSSYASWREQATPGFVFAVKGGRFITHMRRMRGVDSALGNFFGSGVLGLGESLGPFLWQVPARETFDAEVLDAFLAALPRTVGEAKDLARGRDEKLPHDPVFGADVDRGIRHAFEPRHESFASEEALAVLRRHGVALVASDGAGGWPLLDERTADFDYVRLHGAEELYTSGYSEPQLDAWAQQLAPRLEAGRDVYVYFDNDAKVHAPFDAIALRTRLAPFTATSAE